MAKTDVRSLLKAHDKASKSVEAATGGGSDLPKGDYQCVVEKPANTNLVNQDKDGAVRARVALRVIAAPDEDLIGRKTNTSWNLLSREGDLDETGVAYFKKAMLVMGVEIDGIGDIDETMPAILGATVAVAVVESDAKREDGTPYLNVFINSLISPASDAPAEPKSGAKKTSVKRGTY